MTFQLCITSVILLDCLKQMGGPACDIEGQCSQPRSQARCSQGVAPAGVMDLSWACSPPGAAAQAGAEVRHSQGNVYHPHPCQNCKMLTKPYAQELAGTCMILTRACCLQAHAAQQPGHAGTAAPTAGQPSVRPSGCGMRRAHGSQPCSGASGAPGCGHPPGPPPGRAAHR
jgi:hypothetical protein